MPSITPLEQKGGVEGRQMTDVIRNIDLIRDHNDDGYLVCLDQAKAFDRVNHAYLFEVMKKIGINGNFLKAVLELYKNIYQPGPTKRRQNGENTNRTRSETGVSPKHDTIHFKRYSDNRDDKG